MTSSRDFVFVLCSGPAERESRLGRPVLPFRVLGGLSARAKVTSSRDFVFVLCSGPAERESRPATGMSSGLDFRVLPGHGSFGLAHFAATQLLSLVLKSKCGFLKRCSRVSSGRTLCSCRSRNDERRCIVTSLPYQRGPVGMLPLKVKKCCVVVNINDRSVGVRARIVCCVALCRVVVRRAGLGKCVSSSCFPGLVA